MFGYELRDSEIHKGTEYIICEGATALMFYDDVLSYGFIFM